MEADAFFQHATLRICGSLEIEEAPQRLLVLLKNAMPVERLFLQYYDADYESMRTIAYADESECVKLDLLTPLVRRGQSKSRQSAPGTGCLSDKRSPGISGEQRDVEISQPSHHIHYDPGA